MVGAVAVGKAVRDLDRVRAVRVGDVDVAVEDVGGVTDAAGGVRQHDGRIRRDSVGQQRAGEDGPGHERDDDAEGARTDPPVALLALAPVEEPIEVALLEVDGPARAVEDVRDPRHRRPPSPCGTRRARSASTSGSSRR